MTARRPWQLHLSWSIALAFCLTTTVRAAGEAPDEVSPDEGAALDDRTIAPHTPTGASSVQAPDTGRSTPTGERPVLDEQTALTTLRALEGKLSVGSTLSPDEAAQAFALLRAGGTPRVRAVAAGVVAWLPGEEPARALVDALVDEAPEVRGQAAAGALALVAKAPVATKALATERARMLLEDPSDEVACHGIRLYAVLADAPTTRAAAESLAADVSDVRHGCFREVTGMEERAIRVQPPVLPRAADGTTATETSTTNANDPLGGLGSGLFIATAATAGAVAGGFLVPSLVPARDTLTYTRRTTSHAREEPSIALTLGLGLATSAAFAGAAYGVTWLTDGVAFAPAASTALMTVAGGAFGFGLALSMNFQEPWAGASLISSTVGGLLVGGVMSLVLPPTAHDLTLIGATAGAFALFGTLLTYTIVPVGYPTVLFGAKRNDFAVGAGLMSGAFGAMGALVASPVLDFSYGRLLAASGAALATTMTGLAVTYLVTPVNIDIRSRVAAGVGTAFGVASGLLVFVLLPSSWADALEHVDVEVGREALVLDDGELRLGLPSFWIKPSDPIVGTKVGTEVGIGLFGGRF
jgi:hypothetical protein